MTGNTSKTKILCTLGPATASKDKIRTLISMGIDGVRLNFSHGSYEDHTYVLENIRQACLVENSVLSVLQDLQGPKIRIGDLTQNEIEIVKGDKIEITIDSLPGTKDRISTSYKSLSADASPGDIILINDGLIRLVVISKTESSVYCEIIEGGLLKPRKGMNLPGMQLSTPSLTEKDMRDIEFAMKYNADYIALSFVRRPEDILTLKNWLQRKNYSRPVIAKIEKKEAVDNFQDILEVADGIMVARGDLGVEMPPQEVPVIQKQIIRQCNSVGKLVITATQMLESMINNPVPTRAEASDVANAVWDGTDVVMLSGETAVGSYPAETVKMMNDIVLTAEAAFEPHRIVNYTVPSDHLENLFDSAGRAAVQMADQVNAAAIVVFTHHGKKARVIAKYRPKARIIALSPNPETISSLNLCRGVIPLFMDNIEEEEPASARAAALIKERMLLKEGDVVVFTAGSARSDSFQRHSWMRFATI